MINWHNDTKLPKIFATSNHRPWDSTAEKARGGKWFQNGLKRCWFAVSGGRSHRRISHSYLFHEHLDCLVSSARLTPFYQWFTAGRDSEQNSLDTVGKPFTIAYVCLLLLSWRRGVVPHWLATREYPEMRFAKYGCRRSTNWYRIATPTDVYSTTTCPLRNWRQRQWLRSWTCRNKWRLARRMGRCK